MKSRIVIDSVQPDSAAHDANIEQGDVLLSINGQEVLDIFDYRYLTADSNVLIEIEKKDGEIWEIEVEKEEYEDLGLDFENSWISEVKSCTNKCVFCFIDQLPKGMRETVYFKDDDSRLSFLSGNYITLTNMNDKELERIIRYKMTPVNVSVHTTNPELRKRMLGNRFAGDVKDKINILVHGGITVNAQIVLCRGLNDGAELDKTLEELTDLYPGVASISVVPVGLTKWREDLYKLEPFDSKAAANVLQQVGSWQQKLLKRHNTRLVYLADEFYILAGVKLPACEEYEDFPQIENGVGLMSLFMDEFYEYLKNNAKKLDNLWMKMFEARDKSLTLPALPSHTRAVSIATGVSAYNFIKTLAQILEKRYNNLKVQVYPIINHYFGENVTVTGLLTGGDIVAQLGNLELGNELLISRSMMKSGEELFLDDFTVEVLRSRLDKNVTVVENSGADFVNKILGIKP